MSKFVKEALEGAQKLLGKKGEVLAPELKAELDSRLKAAEAMGAEYLGLRDAAKQKRLDIEANAKALQRATRTAKKTLKAQKAGAKSPKKKGKEGDPA